MAKTGDDREARLAAALRANLKRRKAQARTAIEATTGAVDDAERLSARETIPDQPGPEGC